MRYPSRRLYLCALLLAFMALFSSSAFALDKVGNFSVEVSSADAGDYGVLSSDNVSKGEWYQSESDAPDLPDGESIVLTIPTISIDETKSYIAAVSYDFSAITGKNFASASEPLKFYARSNDTSPDEAKFLDTDKTELTAYKINQLAHSDTPTTTVGGFIVMNLKGPTYTVDEDGETKDNPYTPFVTVSLVSQDGSIVNPIKTELKLVPATSSDTYTFTYSGDKQGSIFWTASSDKNNFATFLRPKLTSSDEGSTLKLQFVNIHKSADQYVEDGTIKLYATDSASGAVAETSFDFTVKQQLLVSPDKALISVDLGGTVELNLQYSYNVSPDIKSRSASMDWKVNETLWTSLEGSDTPRSKLLVIAPYDSFMENEYWPVEVTLKDCEGIGDSSSAGDSRGIAVAKINVYVYGALSVDVANETINVSSADKPEITFNVKNASGDLSFAIPVNWLKADGNKLVFSSVDASLAGTTQTVTVTAKDDRGRAGNERGVSTTTFRVSIAEDVAPALVLTLSTEALTVNRGGTGSATAKLLNASGDISYSSSASWVSVNSTTGAITVAYNSSFANSTQEAVITGTSGGRSANATLSVTFGGGYPIPDPDPDYTLSLATDTSATSVSAGGADAANLTLSGANGTGVTWTFDYTMPDGSARTGNPLGLDFSSESSSSATLLINPDADAVEGTYTVTVHADTTSGTSTGGDTTITVTVTPSVLDIAPQSRVENTATGSTVTMEFEALHLNGNAHWSITNKSWTSGLTLDPASLENYTTESVTLTAKPLYPGEYSFTVVVEDEDGNTASSNVTINVTGEPVPDSGDISRADIAPVINAEVVSLTAEQAAALKQLIGLSASEDIKEFTAENILDPVKPDPVTEHEINRLGYQLAANLSRFRVSEGGYYVFKFTIPGEFVGLDMRDLTVFSQRLASNVMSVASVNASAYEDNGLEEGHLAGTDGNALTQAEAEMLGVVELEPNSTSGTYFASVVIPDARSLPILPVAPIEVISDELRNNVAQSLSADIAAELRPTTQANLKAPSEPSEEIIQLIKDSDNYELAYRFTDILVEEDGAYAVEISLPAELVGMSTNDLKLYLIDPEQTSSSMKPALLIDAIAQAYELDMFGLNMDTWGEKALAVLLLQGGKSLLLTAARIILMLLMGGCQVSLSGMGVIALTGVALILGSAKFFSRSRR